MATELSVLTFNIWALPGNFSSDKRKRIEAIGQAVCDLKYDVVCLQEVWTKSDYKEIKKYVSKTYPYHHYFYSGLLGSGLCTFSKWPIEECFYYRFPLNGYFHMIHHGDWCGGKGVGIVQLNVQGLIVNVFNTHLHAQYSLLDSGDNYLAHRVVQAFDTALFIKLSAESADVNILAGDLNAEPTSLCMKIISCVAGLDDVYDLAVVKELKPETNDCFRNTYRDKTLETSFPGRRIDYVLMKSKPNIKYLGVSVDCAVHLWRIIRFWKSEEEPYFLNTIFEVPITKEVKSKAKIYKLNNVSKTSWMTQEEFEQLYHSGDHQMCPDIIIHITIDCGATANLELLKDCAIVQNYNLIEVTKEQVIDNSRSNVFDHLLSCLILSVSDITILHNEYLKFTYPNIIMGMQGLQRFGSLVGWNDYLLNTAYRGVDLSSKHGITFREFLYLIHAVDPFSEFKGNAIEARNRFLFRCFDYNNDEKLSPTEFVALIRSVQASRNPKDGHNITIELEIEMTLRAMELRPGSDVPINNFIHVAGTPNYAYFLNVLRASTTITDFIANIKERQILHVPTKPKTGSETTSPWVNTREYVLSSYMTRINDGVVAETIDIDKVDGIILKDIKRPLERSSSDDAYSGQSPPQNEVLEFLKYFANPEKIEKKENESEGSVVSGNEVNRKESIPKEVFSWGSADFGYFVQLLIQISGTITELFKQEKRMLILKSPIYIIGDVHGNIQDLCCFERDIWPLGISLLPCNLLFLGDYVDRGESSIETVAYLFAQKIRYPQTVFLVRGNHEIRTTQRQNVNYSTFYKECTKRCGTELGNTLWNAVNDAFDCMPLAALVDQKVFCCHGGIPPPWVCPTIQAIQNIPLPLPNPEINGIAWELMWNDPARECEISDKVKLEMAANDGFSNNIRRSTGHIFNEKALDRFLQVNQLSFIIRAHESQKAGFQIHHNWKMLTVFSSSFYTGFNKAACALIRGNGKIKVIQLTTDSYHPTKLKSSITY